MASSSSKTETPPLPARILVGRVIRPHGVRGEVAVDVASDRPARFAAGSRLRATIGDAERELRVERARPVRAGLLVTFAGIGDRDEAEALRGAALEVDRSAVPPAAAGEYYYWELVGALCVDERAGEIGRVADVEESPAGLLLLVEDGRGRRLVLPFVTAFVAGVDRAARRIDWRLPEGLIEACASRS